jgi:CRP-like cAMP-binding protein
VEQLKITERAEFERNTKNEKSFPLKGIPIFEDLTKKQISMLESIVHREFFGKDEVIIKEGSEVQKLYVILKGKARVIHNSSGTGEDVILDEVGVGETMGEVTLVINAPHNVTVTAIESTELITIEREDLFDLMEGAPEFAAKMWNHLAESLGNRLRNSNDRYLSHTRDIHDDVADKLIGTGPLDEINGPNHPTD